MITCKICDKTYLDDVCPECKDLSDLEKNVILNQKKQNKLTQERLQDNKKVLKDYRIK